MNTELILTAAKKTIEIETNSINNLGQYIDESFVQVVDLINNCKGRLVVSGVGKSAIIAQKIVATLNSTGTASLYMHAADAIHGDLGMIKDEDIVLVISKSGDSAEIKTLVTLLKKFGNSIIGMVGNTSSYLATNSHYIINSTVETEACPNNLAPTSSTTAQMVMGDALAVSLMEVKGFNSNDFAKYHPGGMLGKKLFLTVENIIGQQATPLVIENDSINKIIVEISNKRLGATAVVNNTNGVVGIITDGDLRRMLEKGESFSSSTARDIMSKAPYTINSNELATTALELMQQKNISQLIVLQNNNYIGIIHIHDLLKEGIR